MKIMGVVGSARKQSRSGVNRLQEGHDRRAITAAIQKKMMEMMAHSA